MYLSPNINLFLQDEQTNYPGLFKPPFMAEIQTGSNRNQQETSSLHFTNPNKLTYFKNMDYNQITKDLIISEEGQKELKSTLGLFAKEIREKYQTKTLNVLKEGLKINPSHIEYKDPVTGLQIVAVNNGLSYLITPRGLIIQMTPDAIKVKELDGTVKDLDVSEMKEALKHLTEDVSKEVNDWIRSQNQPLYG